jgi:hypothetical protein
MDQQFTTNELWKMVATIDHASNHLADCDEWNQDLQDATNLLTEARRNAARAAIKKGGR